MTDWVNKNLKPGTPQWEEAKRWFRHHASKCFTGGIMAQFAFEELKAMHTQEKEAKK
ncbi:hypothetical protein LCGC14_0566780 [marine sediment metagenome]|uniref:Uncharacterized protein n=1 Tax=marine sediment metagenome TaxID=412755 RepID=A0A0F9U6N0_9ZZZZ